MKTNSTSRSPFFNPRVLVGSTLCSAGILLASAELYTLPTGTVNPVPLINQPLVPDAVAPGGAEFTLTVNGANYTSGATVQWGATGLTTTSWTDTGLASGPYYYVVTATNRGGESARWNSPLDAVPT